MLKPIATRLVVYTSLLAFCHGIHYQYSLEFWDELKQLTKVVRDNQCNLLDRTVIAPREINATVCENARQELERFMARAEDHHPNEIDGPNSDHKSLAAEDTHFMSERSQETREHGPLSKNEHNPIVDPSHAKLTLKSNLFSLGVHRRKRKIVRRVGLKSSAPKATGTQGRLSSELRPQVPPPAPEKEPGLEHFDKDTFGGGVEDATMRRFKNDLTMMSEEERIEVVKNIKRLEQCEKLRTQSAS